MNENNTLRVQDLYQIAMLRLRHGEPLEEHIVGNKYTAVYLKDDVKSVGKEMMEKPIGDFLKSLRDTKEKIRYLKLQNQ